MTSVMPDVHAAAGGGGRTSLPVRYRGVVRGVAVQGSGTLTFHADRAELRPDAVGAPTDAEAPLGAPAAVRVEYDAVRSLERSDAELALRVERLGELRLLAGDASAAASIAAQFLTRCCTLPELTSALPTLGSRRATADAADEHQRFFAPLLEARRAAERAGDAEGMMRALDARALDARLDETLLAFAQVRHPGRASARRALEARLDEGVEPLRRALTSQDTAARALRESVGEARLARWRDWTDGVRLTFLRADECWRVLREVLVATPVPPRRGWRS